MHLNTLQATNAKYAEAAVGSEQEVMFEGDEIQLDIAAEGVVLENGWTITPFTHPGVSLDYTSIDARHLGVSLSER